MGYHRTSSSTGWNSEKVGRHRSSGTPQVRCRQSTHVLGYDTLKRIILCRTNLLKCLLVNTKQKEEKIVCEILRLRRLSVSEGTSPVDDAIQAASLGHRELLAVTVALDGGLWIEVFRVAGVEVGLQAVALR